MISARTWWHSFVESVDFLMVAYLCGAALMLGIAALSKDRHALAACKVLSKLLVATIFAHVLLMACELALLLFEGTTGAMQVLSRSKYMRHFIPLSCCFLWGLPFS